MEEFSVEQQRHFAQVRVRSIQIRLDYTVYCTEMRLIGAFRTRKRLWAHKKGKERDEESVTSSLRLKAFFLL